MDARDFVNNFSACLDHTPASAIGPGTEFKKLDEWSSIFALIVIAMVDTDYHKVLTAEDIKSASTLSDLFHLIQSK
jgi:acyl carrier protein